MSRERETLKYIRGFFSTITGSNIFMFTHSYVDETSQPFNHVQSREELWLTDNLRMIPFEDMSGHLVC